MKKLLLALSLFVMPVAFGQQSTYYNGLYADSGTSVPGSCTVPAFFQLTTNNTFYECGSDHTFHAVGGSGSDTYGGVDCKDLTGSTTTYTCPVPTPVPSAYAKGLLVIFVPQTTNSGTTPSLNVAGLGAKTIKAAAATSVTASALIAGTPYLLEYDGTQFVQAGGGATAGTAAVTCAVSAASSIACTHNFGSGTNVPWVVCNDASGNELGGTSASTSIIDIVATSTNVVTVTFSGSTTGSCRVSTGSMGPKGDTGTTGAAGANGTGNNAYCADATGSTTTYTCTGAPTVVSLTGLLVTFKPQTTNSGSSTLNVSGLGAKTLKQSDCSTNLSASALTGGSAYLFSYDGTNFCQSAGAGGGGSVTPYQLTVHRAAAFGSFPGDTVTSISFDTADTDTTSGSMWNISNPTRMVAPVDGYYLATCSMQSPTMAPAMYLGAKLNGTILPYALGVVPGGEFLEGQASGVVHMTAGQYIECFGEPQQTSMTPAVGYGQLSRLF